MAKRNINNQPASKSDVREIVTEVSIGFSETILDGVQQMFDEQNKINDKKFATKEDIKREISWVRDDINGLKADLSDTVSRKDFNHFKAKVDRFTTS